MITPSYMGWECPVCHMCYAPSVESCRHNTVAHPRHPSPAPPSWVVIDDVPDSANNDVGIEDEMPYIRS